MISPNYKDGSIVNLMSSIAGAFGKRLKYNQLKLLKSRELRKSKNIVLLVIDGLGSEYLKNKTGFLKENMKGEITSVFLPTTACAITTFATGLAPQEHAVTGWYMNLKEIGMVTTVLPFVPRVIPAPLDYFGISKKDIFKFKKFKNKIKASSYTITKQEIKNREINANNENKKRILGYSNLDGFFKQIKTAINKHNKKKYIYAYWPYFDEFSHEFGVKSKETKAHFKKLDKQIEKFVKGLRGTDTALIITADHGLIDSNKKERINLDDYPKIKECLSMPLCGEPRTRYCYVHPDKARQFEKEVKNKLKGKCELFKSKKLVDKNFFGIKKANPELNHRIGDYILIMKDNYIMKDFLLEEPHWYIGNHGGISKEEMLVPLIFIKTK